MFRIPLNLIHSNLVKGSPEVEVIVLHAGSVLSPVSRDVGFPHPPAAPHSVKSLAVRRERAAPITTSRSSTTATIYNTTILQTTKLQTTILQKEAPPTLDRCPTCVQNSNADFYPRHEYWKTWKQTR